MSSTSSDAVYNYIIASVNYLNVKALVDTGASRSCISETFFHKLQQSFKTTQSIEASDPTHLLSANGQQL